MITDIKVEPTPINLLSSPIALSSSTIEDHESCNEYCDDSESCDYNNYYEETYSIPSGFRNEYRKVRALGDYVRDDLTCAPRVRNQGKFYSLFF